MKEITDGTNTYVGPEVTITVTRDTTLTAICKCYHDVKVNTCD